MKRFSLSVAGWCLLVSVLLLFGTAGANAVWAQGKSSPWSLPRNISDTVGASRLPRIASDMEGNVHVVWSENVETAPSAWGNAVYYTQFRNGGWSKPVDIVYNGSSIAMLPAIAVDDKGYVHVIWTDQVHLYHQAAPVANATNAAAWSKRRIISWNGQESAYWSDLQIVGNTIHVAWSGSPSGLWDIAYTRSTDGGLTWKNPTQVTETVNVMETRPSMAVDRAGVVYLMWGQNADNDDPVGPLMFSRSADGTRWELPVRGTPFEGASDLVSLLVDSQGRLHQIWQQGGEWHSTVEDPNHGLYHRWSEDGGKTWTKPTRISRGYSYLSAAVDSASGLHVIWSEPDVVDAMSLENQNLLYASWNGRDWSAPVQIAARQGDMRPSLVIAVGNKLSAVWGTGKRGETSDILFASATADAPESTPKTLPTPASQASPTPTPGPTVTPTAMPKPTASFDPTSASQDASLPLPAWFPMVASIAPAFLLVALVLAGTRLLRR